MAEMISKKVRIIQQLDEKFVVGVEVISSEKVNDNNHHHLKVKVVNSDNQNFSDLDLILIEDGDKLILICD